MGCSVETYHDEQCDVDVWQILEISPCWLTAHIYCRECTNCRHFTIRIELQLLLSFTFKRVMHPSDGVRWKALSMKIVLI